MGSPSRCLAHSRHLHEPSSLLRPVFLHVLWDPVFTAASWRVARHAHSLPTSAALRLKTFKAGKLFFPGWLRLAATMKAPSPSPTGLRRLKKSPHLLSWASEQSGVARKGGSRGGALIGDASAEEETQWIKEEGASKHEFLFSRRRAKSDFIAIALRAAAVGFDGRGSAGKSISGAAVWRGSKKGH